ncbi:MAG: hypothetical protein BWY72_02428 [Bacteroidetes bacterium ADurb.Bin416]|nr:MAG: hypothetical protein BWY72_02428 [Bacteroidetes bacterium ADurb.Bin416]
MVVLFVALAPENPEIQPEHVESGQTCSQVEDAKNQLIVFKRGNQYFILTEETGKRWNTSNGQAGNQKSNVCNGEVLTQSTHILHFITVNGVNHGTGTQEEEGLEESVGGQVEHGRHVTQSFVPIKTGNAQGRNHVGNLRDRREGQHAFDVSLCTSYNGSKQGRSGTDVANDG